jgi:drug/metabolite transporter (DMT)-like permease
MIASAILLTLLSPAVARQPVTLTSNVLTSVIILGVPGTGIAYVLNYRLIADEGAMAASTVTYLLPIVAVVLGVLILSEPLSWNLAVGGLVILVGVGLSEGQLGERRLLCHECTKKEIRPESGLLASQPTADRRSSPPAPRGPDGYPG